jgi:predicted RecB family nuclease
MVKEIKSLLKEELGETREELIEKLHNIEKEFIVIKKMPVIKGQIFQATARHTLQAHADEVREIGAIGTKATDLLVKKGQITTLVECKSKKLPSTKTASSYHTLISKFVDAMDERKVRWGIIVTEKTEQLPKKEPIDIIKKGNRIILLTTVEHEHIVVAYELLLELAKIIEQKKISLKIEILKELNNIFKDLSNLKEESHWFVEKAIEIERKGKDFEGRFGKEIENGKNKIQLLLEHKETKKLK